MGNIEVTNFNLTYDGIYRIQWDNHKLRVYLELNTILRMLEIEGMSFDHVDRELKDWKPLHFQKVTMIFDGEKSKNGRWCFRTSDISENHVRPSLTFFEVDLKETPP
jgi:hypothetical protein